MRIIDWSSDVCSFDLIGLVTPDQEHSKRFVFATLLAILPAAALAEPLSFDEALARAANSAPLLDAREQQIRAWQSAAIAAGQLPDPKHGIGLDNFPISGQPAFSLTRENMTMEREIGRAHV